MKGCIFVLCAAVAILSCWADAATLQIKPTTTLAAQTTSNTSAAPTFITQPNGNSGPANISKLDIHSLLYPGAQTKIFAHLVLWFGESNHMNIGYSSTDPAQVKRQVEDMISRGIDGVVMVWYGPNIAKDQAAKAQHILGPFGVDCDLRRWGLKLAERGGRSGKKRAIVATARKLAVLLHHLWVSGEVYEPLHNSRRTTVAAAA